MSVDSPLVELPDIPSTCLVCGEDASCRHYGVPSCCKCKSFFRRAVFSKRLLKCAKSGGCQSDKEVYRCRSCRFDKCVRVGMRREGIQNTHTELRFNKRGAQTSIGRSLSVYDECVAANVKNLLYVEAKVKQLRSSTYFPYSVTKSIGEYLEEPCVLNHTRKYEPVTSFSKPSAYVLFDSGIASSGRKFWMLLDLILAINYYKTVDVFTKLAPPDQLALLKGTIRQVASFHASFDAFSRGCTEFPINPDGFVPFSHSYYKCPAYEKWLKSSCIPLCAKNNVTAEQAALLKAIIALNHSAPGLSGRSQELIVTERTKNVNALMRIVKRESSEDSWFSAFQNLYDIVNRNIHSDQDLTDLLFAKVVPLVSSCEGRQIERIWWELLI